MTKDAQVSMRLADWQSLGVRLLWIYRGAVMAPVGHHRNNHLVAWRLREGTVEIRGERTSLRAEAGEWIFPPSRGDWRRFSPDARMTSIHFLARWPDGRLLFDESEPERVSAADLPELEGATDALVRAFESGVPAGSEWLAQEGTDLFSWLEIERAMRGWLQAYVRARLATGATLVLQGTREPRVLQSLHLIEHWPVSEPFDPKKLAARIGMSVSQLNRLFVQETERTPRRHFEERRLEAAHQLLRTSKMQIKEVAYALGFKQPTHFSHWFREKTGDFPLARRQVPQRLSEAGAGGFAKRPGKSRG